MIRIISGFLIGCAIVGPMTWWIADREAPHIRYGGVIEPKEIHPNEMFGVQWDIHTNRACPEFPEGKSVQRVIIDSAGKRHEFEPVEAVAGRQGESKTHINRALRMPMGLTDGPARYRSIACFACNWTQRTEWTKICVDKPDLTFTILPRTAP